MAENQTISPKREKRKNPILSFLGSLEVSQPAPALETQRTSTLRFLGMFGDELVPSGTAPVPPGTALETPGTTPETLGTAPETPGTSTLTFLGMFGGEPVPPGTTPVPPGTAPEIPGTPTLTFLGMFGEPVPPGTVPRTPWTMPVPPGTAPETPGTTPEPPETVPLLSETAQESTTATPIPVLSGAPLEIMPPLTIPGPTPGRATLDPVETSGLSLNFATKKGRRFCSVACCEPPFPTGTSFHTFPKDEDLCQSWIKACKRKDPMNPNTARICSQHFAREDLERDMRKEMLYGQTRKKLRKGAIPKLLLLPDAKPPKITERQKRMEKHERERLVQTLLQHSEPMETDCPDPGLVLSEENFVHTASQTEVAVHHASKACLAKAVIHSVSSQTESRSCNMSTQTDDDILKKKNFVLRTKLQTLQRQITNMRRKQQSPSKKVKACIIKKAFEKSSWTHKQVQMFTGGKKMAKWESEDIVLGLTLRALSKKAYQFLRQTRLLPLPGLTTLRDHIKAFKCEPGVQHDTLQGIFVKKAPTCCTDHLIFF